MKLFLFLCLTLAIGLTTGISQTSGFHSEELLNVSDDPGINQLIKLIDGGELEEALKLVHAIRERASEDNDTQLLAYTYYYEGKCLIHRYSVDDAIRSYRKAIAIGSQNDIYFIQALSFNALSIIYGFKGQRSLSNRICDTILKIPNIPDDVQSDAYTIKGEYYFLDNQLDSAFKYRLLAYKIDTACQDTISMAYTATDLGKIYLARGQKDSALHYFIEGAETASKYQKHRYKLGAIYLSISQIFTELGNFYKAREYANLALDVTDVNQTKSAYNSIIYHLAFLDEIEGFHESAINHYRSASMHYDSINSHNSWLICNIGLANSLIETGQIEEAATLISKVGDRLNHTELSSDSLRLLIVQAKLSLKQGDLQKALELTIRYDQLQTQSRTLVSERNAEKLYADVYAAMNQPQKSIIHLRRYHAIRDSLANQNQAYIIHDLESKYQKSIQDREIENLTLEKGLLDQQLTRRNRIIMMAIIFLVITIILVAVIYRMYQNIKHKNDLISFALSEKETLLKEIHHRVKNNLQIISSLLSLQSRSLSDPNAVQALQESQTRVRSMALIHQNLYQHDNMVQVNVSDYISNLSREIIRTYTGKEQNIRLQLDIENVQLDLDTVIPLGLVINELITNSVKYAFTKREEGTIRIQLKTQPDGLRFRISDNGVGLPPDFDINQTKSLGFRLVRSFCNKMEAEYHITNENGTTIELNIPSRTIKMTDHA